MNDCFSIKNTFVDLFLSFILNMFDHEQRMTEIHTLFFVVVGSLNEFLHDDVQWLKDLFEKFVLQILNFLFVRERNFVNLFLNKVKRLFLHTCLNL